MAPPRKPIKAKAIKGKLIGYAQELVKLSLVEQNRSLEQLGCWNIYNDVDWRNLPQLDLALMDLRPGDTLVVRTMLCLGRSMDHKASILVEVQQSGAGFYAIDENIDTTTPRGRLFVRLMLIRNAQNRKMQRELTMLGLEAARQRGRIGGRPTVLPAYKVAQAREMIERGHHSFAEIADKLGVARSSLYNAGLARRKK